MASPSHSPSRLDGDEDNPSMHDHVSDSLGDEHMNDFDATDMHDLYVDHEAFGHLLNHTTDLEKQVAGLNENISRMSDLFNQFMRQNRLSVVEGRILRGRVTTVLLHASRLVPPQMAWVVRAQVLGTCLLLVKMVRPTRVMSLKWPRWLF